MSNITIQLLKKVDVSNPAVGKTYQQMVVTHTDMADNKSSGKKIFDFTTPKEVWKTLLDAQPLQFFEITRQKNDKGYWVWSGIKEVTGVAAATSAASTASVSPQATAAEPRSAAPARVGSWETPDERAQKQIYIVRQSNINSAIAFCAMEGPGIEPNLDRVLEVARRFEDYVFHRGVAGLTDDFPE